MNYLRTSIKNNKKYFKFLIFLFLLGFLIGFMLYKKLDNDLFLKEIKNISTYLSQNNLNYILIHLVFLSLLIVSSVSIIGFVLFPFYIVFESVSITYNILSFTSVFKLNGFIYGLLYNLLSKGVFILFLLLIFKKIIDNMKSLIYFFKNRNSQDFYNNIFNNIKKVGLYLLIIIVNDVLIYLFLNLILSKLVFIIN